jgi:tRNA(Phe) wybutosine-synthesizing methylase Tyw3
MPTILRSGALRFFFYSLENAEPPHVHVESGDATAKYWLEPVELARSCGFRASELTQLRATIIEHRNEFLEAWHAHFGKSA